VKITQRVRGKAIHVHAEILAVVRFPILEQITPGIFASASFVFFVSFVVKQMLRIPKGNEAHELGHNNTQYYVFKNTIKFSIMLFFTKENW